MNTQKVVAICYRNVIISVLAVNNLKNKQLTKRKQLQ